MPTAIPTSSTIEEVVWPIGSQRLGMASSEIAEITAVPASSSGMPAAISAPNTIEQQDQRDRDRGDLGLPEVLAGDAAGGPVQAGAARLLDLQPGMVRRDGGDRVHGRHHRLVVVTRVTRDVEGDQRRPAADQAGAAERRLDVGRRPAAPPAAP